MDEEYRKKIVKILKELQLDSMGVDLATPPEDNVEYLTDKLHWAEVQIEALIDSYSREAIIAELEKLHRSEGNGFTRDYNNITDELIDERIAELRASSEPEGKPNE